MIFSIKKEIHLKRISSTAYSLFSQNFSLIFLALQQVICVCTINFNLIFSFILCLSHNIKQYFIDFAGFDSPREYQKNNPESVSFQDYFLL